MSRNFSLLRLLSHALAICGVNRLGLLRKPQLCDDDSFKEPPRTIAFFLPSNCQFPRRVVVLA